MRKLLTGSDLPERTPEPLVYGKGTSFRDGEDLYERFEEKEDIPEVIVLDEDDVTTDDETADRDTDTRKFISIPKAAAVFLALILGVYLSFFAEFATRTVTSEVSKEKVISEYAESMEISEAASVKRPELVHCLETEEELIWLKSLAELPEMQSDPIKGTRFFDELPEADYRNGYFPEMGKYAAVQGVYYEVDDGRIHITCHMLYNSSEGIYKTTLEWDSFYPDRKIKNSVLYGERLFARKHYYYEGDVFKVSDYRYCHNGIVGLVRDTLEYLFEWLK